MRSSTKALATALLIGVTGCGAGPERPESGAPSSDSTASTPSATTSDSGESKQARDPGRARRALREASDVLRREGVTGFRAETTIDTEPFVVTDGIARAGAWRATSSFDDPATPEHDDRVMDALSSDGSVWMQMRDWPADQAECWLQMSPTQVPLEVSALLPREPIYITLVGYLKATGYTSDRNDTTIHATLNLQAALMLFLVKVIREIEITTKQAAAGNVEVEVGVDGGRITDVELRGADVLTAVDDAGATVSAGGRATLESMDITVSYPVKATKDEIVPPAANLITNVDFSGCGAA